jgi:hypothetical protein
VAILDASIRLYKYHSRIDRSSLSTAFPLINKLPVKGQLYRALHKLERRQAARRGAPLMTLDV